MKEIKLSIDYRNNEVHLHYHEQGPSHQRIYNKSFGEPAGLDAKIVEILEENPQEKPVFSVDFTDSAKTRLENLRPGYCGSVLMQLGLDGDGKA